MKIIAKIGDQHNYSYKCLKCGGFFTKLFTVARVKPWLTYTLEGKFINPSDFSCPSCGGYCKHKLVKGHITDTPCDGRCTSAKGPNCDCSCGGKNHGADYRA